MGFFQNIQHNIKTYFDNRFADKLERGLRILNARLEYKPVYQKSLSDLMTPERFTTKLNERRAWYIGDPDILRNFYTTDGKTQAIARSVQLNYFWEKAPNTSMMVHTGIPGLISAKMATLLFGLGFDLKVEVFKTTKTKDEKGVEVIAQSDKVDEAKSDKTRSMIVDTIFEELNIMNLCKESAEDESWCGHIAWKYSYDPDITPFPILEAADLTNFIVTKERNKTTAITFRSWNDSAKNANKKSYRLDEIYTTVRKNEAMFYTGMSCNNIMPSEGDAVIRYELHFLDGDKDTIVPYAQWQSACPELVGSDTDHPLREAYVYSGLKKMLAFEKPNRRPNSEFPGSIYGGSDYDRSIGSFDKLDELWSENAREVREGKDIQLIPASMIPKVETTQDGRTVMKPGKLDEFRRHIILSEGSMDQNFQPKAEVINVQHKTESLVSKWKLELGTVCNNSRISPLTLGVTGLEAVNSGEDSQRERNKATLETRKDKLGLWGPFLNNAILTGLMLITWIQDTGATIPGLEDMDIDFDNCNIKVTFPDYIVNAENADVTMAVLAKQGGIYSIEQAVRTAHRSEKWTEDEIRQEVERIKFEQGVALDNPTALSMNGLLPEPKKEPEPGKEPDNNGNPDDKTKTPPNPNGGDPNDKK